MFYENDLKALPIVGLYSIALQSKAFLCSHQKQIDRSLYKKAAFSQCLRVSVGGIVFFYYLNSKLTRRSSHDYNFDGESFNDNTINNKMFCRVFDTTSQH